MFDKAVSSLMLTTPSPSKFQSKLEAMAVCCLFIACKIEEIKPPTLVHFAACVYPSNDIGQLAETEVEVLRVCYIYYSSNFSLFNGRPIIPTITSG